MLRLRRLLPLLASVITGVFSTVWPASAGIVSGTIRAQGRPEVESADAGGANYASRRYKFIERVNYNELDGFVIYLDQPMPEPARTQRPRARMVQRDGTFVPHVLPVAVGTAVEFPNEDAIFHNVFSMTESNPFDLGLFKRGEAARQIVFERPGRVDLFCSIHTKMNSIVLVVPNAWFTVADARGRWRLPELPAGTYRVRAWHERMPGKVVEVIVPPEGEVRVDFVLGLGGLPKQ
ncbi:MAG TPA: carboxypeptidase regulatory-like domain-containing protein [Opitutaceae bacterium]